MKSEVVVYHAKSGSGGGVLYTQKYGDDNRVVWHWYFNEDAPDSIEAIELNEDGLWDVRMFIGSKTQDYVQEQSFSLVARQRTVHVTRRADTRGARNQALVRLDLT